MKYKWLLVLAFPVAAFNYEPVTNMVAASPLSTYSPEWSLAKYSVCNTAANVTYMNAEEKKLIYIINLMRTNPVLFANTVASKYPDSADMTSLKNSAYFKSLLVTLRRQEPLGLLYPDSVCYVSANCHAVTAGKTGYVGHDRQTADCKTKWVFNGECCDYGHNQALDIVMALLIDENVASLGHPIPCMAIMPYWIFYINLPH